MRLEVDDRLLFDRVRRDEPGAFDALYDRMAGRVYRFAVRLLDDPNDVEDVVAETFAAVHCARRGFRGHSTLETWMFRIAINAANRIRKQRKEMELLPDTLKDPSAGQAHEDIELEDLIRWLPESLRTPFLLVRIESLTYREAAEILGKRTGTIQAQVYEASRRIRSRLFKDMNPAQAERCPL